MAPRPRRTPGPDATTTTPAAGSSVIRATSRRLSLQPNRQQPPSVSTQEPTIKIEALSSDSSFTEDEFSTDSASSGDEFSSTDSEDATAPNKKWRTINLLSGHYILRGVPGYMFVDELSTECKWGNTVSLYRHHVISPRNLI